MSGSQREDTKLVEPMKLPSLKVLQSIRLVGGEQNYCAEAGTEMEVVNQPRKGRKMGIRVHFDQRVRISFKLVVAV